MTDGLSFEPTIVGVVFEHVIDDPRQFFGDDGARDGLVGASADLLIEPAVFGEVLDRVDGHVGEGDFEVLVAVPGAGLVADSFVGVLGPGNESAVGDEVFVGAEALDAVGFKVDGEGGDFAHAGDPDEALNIVVGNEDGLQVVFQGEHLLIEEIDLLIEIVEMEPIGFGESLRQCTVGDDQLIVAVEFAAHVVDADAAGGAFLDEAQTGAHDVAQGSELRADFVCAGNAVQAQQHGEGLGIDLVGLDLGVGDGFQVFGVGEDELDAVGVEEIDRASTSRRCIRPPRCGTRERGEVAEDELGDVALRALVSRSLRCHRRW